MLQLVDTIKALLPQTQCTRCGHEGCKPYAQAIAAGDTINKCPPGGAVTIEALAALLDTEALPLDAIHGTEAPRNIALIREAECIGCTKCIQACPVDAILGSAKRMHTVLANECSGCDLCIEPCPVNCIDMIPAPQVAEHAWAGLRRRAIHHKARYDFRESRLAEDRAADERRRAERALTQQQTNAAPDSGDAAKAPAGDDAKNEIAAALERVKAKKALQQQPDPFKPKPPPEQDQQ